MNLTEYLLEQLESEAAATRRVLQNVPEGCNSWKPHPKSMELGYLAALCARMPAWLAAMIKHDQLEFADSSSPYHPMVQNSVGDLVALLDKSIAEAREALRTTTDDHLMTNWKLLARGAVVAEQPRYVVIRDSLFSHLSHHRGQLTVYLRLNDAKVPALFGPSADERG